jgi:hypothetical protein
MTEIAEQIELPKAIANPATLHALPPVEAFEP